MDSPGEEVAELDQLITQHQRRLRVLKAQRARFGEHTEPHIILEIEDIEGELKGLRAKLHRLRPGPDLRHQRRRREIGVRMALGASAKTVVSMILRQTAVLTLAGCAIGAVGGLALSELARGLLFGIEPNDPLTFASASGSA